MWTHIAYFCSLGRLGNSGLKVSRIILGLASYGNKSWAEWVLEEEEGIKHIKAAYDAGIQTFDAANIYSHGDSERILGKAIKQHNLPRDEIVVLTKSLESQAFISSLAQLRTRLVMSTNTASVESTYLIRSNTRQSASNLTTSTSSNVTGSTTTLSSPKPCKPFMTFSGMWKQTKEDNKDIIIRLEQIAKNRGISMSQVAIAWSLSKDVVAAPIIGTTSLQNLEDTTRAIHVKLTDEEVRQLEESYVAQTIQGYA
ncbi:hypothetical protein RSAG8_04086, partial [Rhizoctonia solani AG-8 WAC10335]